MRSGKLDNYKSDIFYEAVDRPVSLMGSQDNSYGVLPMLSFKVYSRDFYT